MTKVFCAVLLAAAAFAPLSRAAEAPAMAPAALAAPEVEAALGHLWNGIDQSGQYSCRALMTFAFRATAFHWHPERVSRSLELLEAMQDKDPASKTCGNFRWYWNQDRPIDLNAVEFVMQNGIVFWNLYRDALPSGDRDRLRRMIDLATRGIGAHPVAVTYTNIFLMKAWNFIAIGESCGPATLADEGYRMLDQWLAETARNGVHEYLSTTYYATDIESLALIRRFAGRPIARESAEAALRLLWTQCRADWFAPTERLAGAHSRDYDYLTGHGSLDRYLSDWGWLSGLDPSGRADTYRPSPLDTLPDVTSWVPADTSALAAVGVLPRFVRFRFGATPDQVATSYIAAGIAIGTAGRSLGGEDKIFTFDFPGGPKQVMGNLFVDGRGDPYGQNKVVDKNGHRKAHHLVPFIASVQEGPAVLLLASFGSPASLPKGKEALADLVCLATHIDLPDQAAVWEGDREVAVDAGGSAPLDPARPIFVRRGDAAVGFRFLQATDAMGKPLAPVFHRDGIAWHAARISWTHSESPPAGEAHVLFLAVAGENLDEAGFARFRKEIAETPATFHTEGSRVTARAQMGTGTPLEIEADLATGAKKTSAAPFSGIMEVNGVEVGEVVLAGAVPKEAGPAPR